MAAPRASRTVNHADVRAVVAGLGASVARSVRVAAGDRRRARLRRRVSAAGSGWIASGATTLAASSARSCCAALDGAGAGAAVGTDAAVGNAASGTAGSWAGVEVAARVAVDGVITGIVIERPSLIRSRLPRVKASGLAAKIASAVSRIVVGLSATRAAIPDKVSPRTTRYVCPCVTLPPVCPRARGDAFARAALVIGVAAVGSVVAAVVAAAVAGVVAATRVPFERSVGVCAGGSTNSS